MLRRYSPHFKSIKWQNMFAGTTGYGYGDNGRDTLEKIYADIFHTEDAVVRLQFVSGTHAITCALFGNLRPGDTLCYVTGNRMTPFKRDRYRGRRSGQYETVRHWVPAGGDAPERFAG